MHPAYDSMRVLFSPILGWWHGASKILNGMHKTKQQVAEAALESGQVSEAAKIKCAEFYLKKETRATT